MTAQSTYTVLNTYTAPANTAHDIQFNSIPSNYTDLRIVINARGIASATNEDVYFYTAPYASDESFTYMQGNGSTAVSGRVTGVNQTTIGNVPSGNATSGMFGTITLDLFNYSNPNVYKTWLVRNANDMNGSGLTYFSAGLKRNTYALTTVVIFPSASTYWAAGSTFTLYGIQAA